MEFCLKIFPLLPQFIIFYWMYNIFYKGKHIWAVESSKCVGTPLDDSFSSVISGLRHCQTETHRRCQFLAQLSTKIAPFNENQQRFKTLNSCWCVVKATVRHWLQVPTIWAPSVLCWHWLMLIFIKKVYYYLQRTYHYWESVFIFREGRTYTRVFIMASYLVATTACSFWWPHPVEDAFYWCSRWLLTQDARFPSVCWTT